MRCTRSGDSKDDFQLVFVGLGVAAAFRPPRVGGLKPAPTLMRPVRVFFGWQVGSDSQADEDPIATMHDERR